MEHSIIAIPGFSEPVSSISHILTSVVFLIIGAKMIWTARGNGLRVFSIGLYVFCAVFLFSMSGVYHLLEKGSTSNYVLQILDHSGIYLMIAGSFTPFQIILLRGSRRWVPLILIWILAITGLTLTAIFFSDMPESLLLSFFIGMGWMSVSTVWFIREIDRFSLKYIFIGGVLYTIGAFFDFSKWPNLYPQVLEAHELFHFFVMAGALSHLYAIYRIASFPISNTLEVEIRKYPDHFYALIKKENAIFSSNCKESLMMDIKSWVDSRYLKKLRPKHLKISHYEVEIIDPQ